MAEQVRQRERRLTSANGAGRLDSGSPAVRAAETLGGALAVVTGQGLKQLYEGLGVAVLDGGPTLNPSTYDLLAAIHAIAAEEIVVLPNSANVFMAAERAAELSDKRVEVVRSRSLQAGLAAAVAFLPNSGATENAALMAEIVERLRTGGVARAARDDPQGRFHTGDAIGFVDDELVHWGDPEHTLGAVIAALATDAELVTCLRGVGAPLDDDAVRALAPPEVELELSDGGQSSYWWLLSAE
jgi:dihydroxyacetone kinase-like predicted kinase